MTNLSYDVVIVGSGIVGAAAALALAKSTRLTIAILDEKNISSEWCNDHYDCRVSAISLASKNIFKNLNVWQSITEKRISPYNHMQVWDVEEKAEIHFDCADVNANELGFIIEDNVMRSSLLAAIKQSANCELLPAQKLISLQELSDSIILKTDKNDEIRAKLLIAADGANSIVRELAGIELKTWDYDHTAIVTTVHSEISHQKTAWQRFLATGPLAFLPLSHENQCSIVWSTSHEHAETLLSLNEKEFCQTLQEAFNHNFGEINKIEKRYHFPLRMRHAKNYVKPRIALIGDAAHTIHPLAGQGVNLGLLDAVCLVDVISTAYRKNRDYSSFDTLRRYERWRRGDNLAMLASVEVLKRLFAHQSQTVQQIRSFGLNLANRTSVLKNFFTNYALGYRGDLPLITR